MGWQKIVYRCGHVGRVQYYGPINSRDAQASREASNLCEDCRKAERDKRNAESAAANAASDCAPLKGTARQVAWAETIRHEQINEHREVLDRIVLASGGEYNPYAIDSASWWIDRRHRDQSKWLDVLCLYLSWGEVAKDYLQHARDILYSVIGQIPIDQGIVTLRRIAVLGEPAPQAPMRERIIARWAADCADWMEARALEVAAAKSAVTQSQIDGVAKQVQDTLSAAIQARKLVADANREAQAAAQANERAATEAEEAREIAAIVNGTALTVAREAQHVADCALPILQGGADDGNRQAERRAQAERVLAQEAKLRDVPYRAALAVLRSLWRGVTWETSAVTGSYGQAVPSAGGQPLSVVDVLRLS